jgi:filamentous hemagglutinin
MDAIQMDIDDIRSKFGNKYDPAIEEMLEYARTLNPEDFRR